MAHDVVGVRVAAVLVVGGHHVRPEARGSAGPAARPPSCGRPARSSPRAAAAAGRPRAARSRRSPASRAARRGSPGPASISCAADLGDVRRGRLGSVHLRVEDAAALAAGAGDDHDLDALGDVAGPSSPRPCSTRRRGGRARPSDATALASRSQVLLRVRVCPRATGRMTTLAHRYDERFAAPCATTPPPRPVFPPGATGAGATRPGQRRRRLRQLRPGRPGRDRRGRHRGQALSAVRPGAVPGPRHQCHRSRRHPGHGDFSRYENRPAARPCARSWDTPATANRWASRRSRCPPARRTRRPPQVTYTLVTTKRPVTAEVPGCGPAAFRVPARSPD